MSYKPRSGGLYRRALAGAGGAGGGGRLLAGIGGAAAPAGPLFYDEFLGADNTELTAHTPNIDTVGGGWVSMSVQVGKIKSNQGSMDTFAAATIAFNYANVGDADVVITDSVTTANGDALDWNGTLYRATDVNNYWVATLVTATNLMRIAEVTAGGYTSRATTAKAVVKNTTYATTLTLAGNVHTYVMDGSTCTYTSAVRNAVTNHGLSSISQGNVTATRHDNFTITA